MKIRDQKGFVTGLFYVLAGIAAIVVGKGYSVGTAARMGPGFFPLALGILLTLLGASILLGAMLRNADLSTVPRFDGSSAFWICLSIALFALTLQPFGLVAAVVILVITSTAGDVHRNWRHAAICAAVMVALTIGIFIVGLGIPLPILPSFVS